MLASYFLDSNNSIKETVLYYEVEYLQAEILGLLTQMNNHYKQLC